MSLVIESFAVMGMRLPLLSSILKVRLETVEPFAFQWLEKEEKFELRLAEPDSS